MEALFYYLLKSSLLMFLFYGCYQILLRKETLFRFNRYFLLGGLVLSTTLPLLYLTNTIEVSLPQLQQTTKAAAFNTDTTINTFLNLYVISIALYTIGALILFIRLFDQGLHLKKLIKSGQRLKIHTKVHIQTKDKIQPFSFFNKIIYNPTIHTEKELEAILAHEEVHAAQLHSFDILLMKVFLALQWFNPIAWLYQIAIKQNLEFLADSENQQIKINKKAYQYALLRHAVGNHQLSIVNPFFNSLIKKRIVMINQHQSHKSRALKSLIILPLLAFFLLSFNVKEVYKFTTTEQSITTNNVIELIIDKNTTDEQLLKIKGDLAKDNFDFSYSTVRNKEGEIKNISLHISGGNKKSGEVSSRFNTASDNDTIDPTYIIIDTDNNSISIGNGEVVNKTISNKSMVKITKDEGKTSENIVVINKKGKKEVSINGKKLSEEELENLDIETDDGTYILIENNEESNNNVKSSTNKLVSINTTTSDEFDIKISEEQGSGFMFIDNDGEKEPMFYVNGEISDFKTVKKIDPTKIASINVIKGEAAIKKYGKKALHGVIEITKKK